MLKNICCADANATIQRSSGEINAAAGASSASSEGEVRQLKEEIAVLHRVVAGKFHTVGCHYK